MLATAPVLTFVATTDAERARRFYQETLGLPLVEETPFACVFRAGETQLRVTPVEGFTPQPFTVLGWGVDDMDAAVDALAAAGVPFNRYPWLQQDARGIWEAPDGDRVAWFVDPDGNTLSLTQFV
jgi:catechol 2,3-dioxygenase-like lactoylglutathione lyase family enzyme